MDRHVFICAFATADTARARVRVDDASRSCSENTHGEEKRTRRGNARLARSNGAQTALVYKTNYTAASVRIERTYRANGITEAREDALNEGLLISLYQSVYFITAALPKSERGLVRNRIAHIRRNRVSGHTALPT